MLAITSSGFAAFAASAPGGAEIRALQNQINRFTDPSARIPVDGQFTDTMMDRLRDAVGIAFGAFKKANKTIPRPFLDLAEGTIEADDFDKRVITDRDFLNEITDAFTITPTVDPAVQQAVAAVQNETGSIDPTELPDVFQAVSNAITAAAAAGASRLEQIEAGKAAGRIAAATANKKKFVDLKNPWFWAAIGGGIVGVVVIGSFFKRRATPTAP